MTSLLPPEDLGLQEVRGLAVDVASELSTRRGETWTVGAWHQYHAYPAAALDGPGNARLLIQHRPGKVTVTALLPEGTWTHRDGAFTAAVNPARGARAIAQAADARVLRSGYLDILPGKVAQKQARDAAVAARDAAAAEAASLFGLPAPDDGELSLSRFLPEHSKTEFREHSGRVSLDLNGVPQETALRILAVLAADTRAACCYSFGPGHHPDLSTAGCLHEDAERGHDASRQRVTRLLAGHGIGAGRAGQLLDAAYRRDTWGNYDEATGIRAGYDHARGEFTVRIPRRERASSPPAPEQEAGRQAQAVNRGQTDQTGTAAGQSPGFPHPPRTGTPDTRSARARKSASPTPGQQNPPPTRGRTQ